MPWEKVKHTHKHTDAPKMEFITSQMWLSNWINVVYSRVKCLHSLAGSSPSLILTYLHSTPHRPAPTRIILFNIYVASLSRVVPTHLLAEIIHTKQMLAICMQHMLTLAHANTYKHDAHTAREADMHTFFTEWNPVWRNQMFSAATHLQSWVAIFSEGERDDLGWVCERSTFPYRCSLLQPVEREQEYG